MDEDLAGNAMRLGEMLRGELRQLASETDRITFVRGRGLLNAIGIRDVGGVTAWDICLRLKDNGLLVSRACAVVYV